MLFGPEPEAQASPDFSVVDQIIRELQQSILAVDAAIGPFRSVVPAQCGVLAKGKQTGSGDVRVCAAS